MQEYNNNKFDFYNDKLDFDSVLNLYLETVVDDCLNEYYEYLSTIDSHEEDID